MVSTAFGKSYPSCAARVDLFDSVFGCIRITCDPLNEAPVLKALQRCAAASSIPRKVLEPMISIASKETAKVIHRRLAARMPTKARQERHPGLAAIPDRRGCCTVTRRPLMTRTFGAPIGSANLKASLPVSAALFSNIRASRILPAANNSRPRLTRSAISSGLGWFVDGGKSTWFADGDITADVPTDATAVDSFCMAWNWGTDGFCKD